MESAMWNKWPRDVGQSFKVATCYLSEAKTIESGRGMGCSATTERPQRYLRRLAAYRFQASRASSCHRIGSLDHVHVRPCCVADGPNVLG